MLFRSFGSAATLPLVFLMLIVLEFRMRGEETVMDAHFGDAFRNYRARTGRFLPRFARRD